VARVAVVAVMVLGVVVIGAPPGVHAAEGDPVTFMFARGMDNAVWYRIRQNETWGPWRTLGGIATGTPKAGIFADGKLAVFVRGADGGLWERESYDAETWTGWTSLSQPLMDDPQVVTVPWVPGVGEADVMVIGRVSPEQGFVRAHVTVPNLPGYWKHPEPLDPVNNAPPFVRPVSTMADTATRTVYVSDVRGPVSGPGVSVVPAQGFGSYSYYFGFGSLSDAPVLTGPPGAQLGFGRLEDGQLGICQGSDTYWERLGGILTEPPMFGPVIDDVGSVLARGADTGIWSWTRQGWVALGGLTFGAPVGGYADVNRYLLAVRGIDSGVWVRWFDNRSGAWTSWEGLGGIVKDPPSMLMATEGGHSQMGWYPAGFTPFFSGR
jgi:hypothetical protein